MTQAEFLALSSREQLQLWWDMRKRKGFTIRPEYKKKTA